MNYPELQAKISEELRDLSTQERETLDGLRQRYIDDRHVTTQHFKSLRQELNRAHSQLWEELRKNKNVQEKEQKEMEDDKAKKREKADFSKLLVRHGLDKQFNTDEKIINELEKRIRTNIAALPGLPPSKERTALENAVIRMRATIVSLGFVPEEPSATEVEQKLQVSEEEMDRILEQG